MLSGIGPRQELEKHKVCTDLFVSELCMPACVCVRECLCACVRMPVAVNIYVFIFQNALSPYQRVGLVFYTRQLVLCSEF